MILSKCVPGFNFSTFPLLEGQRLVRSTTQQSTDHVLRGQCGIVKQSRGIMQHGLRKVSRVVAG